MGGDVGAFAERQTKEKGFKKKNKRLFKKIFHLVLDFLYFPSLSDSLCVVVRPRLRVSTGLHA